ncbi:MAG: tetratricopeptide repeat protein [Psychrobium sp.]
MKLWSVLLVCFFPLALLADSEQMFDGFDSAHDACYAYSYGYKGVEKDYNKAFKWCGIGHEIEENNSSTTLLAELYFFGYGVKKDLDMAVRLYAQAALSGHEHAAVMVYYVIHLEAPEQFNPKQKEFAFKLLTVAAKLGNEKAQALLEQHKNRQSEEQTGTSQQSKVI